MKALFGQESQTRNFLGTLASGKMPHAWLLTGSKGIGKASFADLAAHKILDGVATGDMSLDSFHVSPDSQTANLIAAGSHPDFLRLERLPKDSKSASSGPTNADLKRNISVDQVRSLQSMFLTKPSFSKYRVIIIDSIDDLESSGANALLKNLEEPPADTVFLLVSHAPDRLLPTIRSRCRALRFDRLSDEHVVAALKQHHPNMDDQEIQALTEAGEGAPGRALALAGLDLAELQGLMEQLVSAGDPTNSLKNILIKKLSLKASQARYEAFIARVPSFIAGVAKRKTGESLAVALQAWEEANDLAGRALPLSLQKSAVIFQFGSLLASLADHKEGH